MSAPAPLISVIVPAYRAGETIAACLAGLLASDLPRHQWELIVVDDGSRDNTNERARGVADVLLTIAEGPRGPAHARNVGAASSRGNLLLFVDADVVVAPSTLSGFATLFAARPTIAAAYGAYDNSPAYPSFVSQYRNLLHSYVHNQFPGRSITFWSGCGAVRRDAFMASGGFDGQRYPIPQVEDIEFGYRLADAGHEILLVPALTGKHLKRWTFRSMIQTDLTARAIPWMHLLIQRRAVIGANSLNLATLEKMRAALTVVALLSGLVALLTQSNSPLWLTLATLGVVVLSNLRLTFWFVRQRGFVFALGTIPLQLLFHIIGALGAIMALATYRARPATEARAALDAAPGHTAAG